MCRGILSAEELRDPKNAEYEKWNTTSVQSVRATWVSHSKDEEEWGLARQLLQGFIDWRKEQPDEYIPKSGVETMYSKEYLQEDYEYLLEHTRPTEDEPLKKHKEFEKELASHYEHLESMFPRKFATIQDFMAKEKRDQESLTLGQKVGNWAITNPMLAGKIIIGGCWLAGVVVGLGVRHWLWPSTWTTDYC
jgi:hypothetical protein